MKKWIKASVILMIAIFALIGVYGCESHKERVEQRLESKFLQLLKENLPQAMQGLKTFETVEDAIIYKQLEREKCIVDSTFLSMSDQTVANVVSVLQKQQMRITVANIVHEYVFNKHVYDGLPKKYDNENKIIVYEKNSEIVANTKPNKLDSVCEPLL